LWAWVKFPIFQKKKKKKKQEKLQVVVVVEFCATQVVPKSGLEIIVDDK
jgi:hypothetical protein